MKLHPPAAGVIRQTRYRQRLYFTELAGSLNHQGLRQLGEPYHQGVVGRRSEPLVTCEQWGIFTKMHLFSRPMKRMLGSDDIGTMVGANNLMAEANAQHRPITESFA